MSEEPPNGRQRWLPGERRAASCTGKLAYDSGTAAARAKSQLERKRRKNMDVYRCHFCSRWHIGRRQPTAIKHHPVKARDRFIRP